MSKKRALCIGINDYPGDTNDLAGCVNDAEDWSAALEARGFLVQKLLDGEAKGEAIRKAMKKLLSESADGDTVIIQYSGHGSFVPDVDGDESDGTDECLCPHDVKAKGPITDDELFEIYDSRPSGVKVVMISDSCHSGTVAKINPFSFSMAEAGASKVQQKQRFLSPRAFLSEKDVAKLGERRKIRSASPPGRYAALLIAACQDTESSWDTYFDGRPNGAFTYFALRCLNNLPADSTYSDWRKALSDSLPTAQFPQTPNLFGSSSMKLWKALQ